MIIRFIRWGVGQCPWAKNGFPWAAPARPSTTRGSAMPASAPTGTPAQQKEATRRRTQGATLQELAHSYTCDRRNRHNVGSARFFHKVRLSGCAERASASRQNTDVDENSVRTCAHASKRIKKHRLRFAALNCYGRVR